MTETKRDFRKCEETCELKSRNMELEQELQQCRQKEAELQRLAIVVRDSNDAITMQDLDGNIVAWNHGAERIYGYTEAEALQMNILRLTPASKKREMAAFINKIKAGQTLESFETRRVTKDGRVLEIWFTATPIVDSDGIVKAVATTERDITEKNKLIRQLAKLSLKDELTGLYNRRGFLVNAQKLLKQVKRRGETAVILYLDMDNLKVINDTAGHKQGDEAIIELARIIKKTFRETDVLARIGGDEFAVLADLTNKKNETDEAERRLKANIDSRNQAVSNYPLSVSIGKAVHGKDRWSLEGLLNIADHKMYEEKQQKKKRAHENTSFKIKETSSES